MNAIDLLLKRQSTPLLQSPAPEKDELQKILMAGMRVPDHAGLLPYEFIVVEKEGLNTLSDIFVETVKADGADQIKIDKTAKMPHRAPMIIIVTTKYSEHDKVPQSEQLITAGCSVHAMQMACVSLGYGAMWRTGALSYASTVKQSLNIDKDNDIVGFLYIGTKVKTSVTKPAKLYDDRVRYLS